MPLNPSSFFVPPSGVPFLLEDKYMRGGFRVVATIAERDAISTASRKAGMRVLVADANFIEYQLKGGTSNSSWQVSGGSVEIAGVTGLQTELDSKASSVHEHAIADVTGLQTELDGKAVSVHEHAIADVTGLQTALDSKTESSDLNAALLTKADSVHAHGVADVTGLQTALDGKVSTQSLTDGLAGKADSVHTHTVANVTGLQTELDGKASTQSLTEGLAGKADSIHVHTVSNVTGLQTELDGKASTQSLTDGLAGKAASVHAHAISDVTGLQTAIDGKAASVHAHAIAEVTGLQTAIDGKASTAHDHTIANVTGLQTAIDGKAASVHAHAIADVTGLQTAIDGKANTTHAHAVADVAGLQTSLNAKFDKAGGTVSGNLTVTGDLIIQGSNTTINTTELEISDPIITLAKNNTTGVLPYAGVKVERGASDAFLVFNEATDRWTAYLSADDLSTAGTMAGIEASTFFGALSGNATSATLAASATKLATTRAISLTGGATATGTFDGTAPLALSVTITDNSHAHTIANVTGLQTALDGKASTQSLTDGLAGKASTVHTHAIADVTGLQTAIDGKASTAHVHTIANVTGLQTAIDGKASTVHTHAISDVTGLQTAIDGKAASAHVHTIANVTGLQTALDGKSDTTHTHPIATTSANGLMSSTDKTKIDGIATSANNYIHPTGDGNQHVPATSTTNNLRVLKAGATAGSAAWGQVAYGELTGVPSTFAPSAHSNHAISDVSGLQSALDAKLSTSGTAANSSLLQGYATSTGAAANTVALRDSAGKITAVDFTMTSDMRHKDVIAGIDDTAALNQVISWDSILYRIKGQDRVMPGHSAQQLLKVTPELVDTSDPEKYAVSYALTSAYYAGAIRALLKRLEKLENDAADNG